MSERGGYLEDLPHLGTPGTENGIRANRPCWAVRRACPVEIGAVYSGDSSGRGNRHAAQCAGGRGLDQVHVLTTRRAVQCVLRREAVLSTLC